MNYSRRQFQLISISAALSTAMTAVSAGDMLEKEAAELKRRDVQQGLNQGINFTDTVRDLLSLVQAYSIEQTLIGGCVLTLAAEQTTDTVHILVMADPLKVAKALGKMNIDGMQSVTGNSIAFSYEGQQFYIEHFNKELYQKRLQKLAPGSNDKDFYIEFAHQLLTYNVQSRRYRDPEGAIGSSSTLELKRVSPAKDSSSVIKTIVESKRLGMEIPKDEQRVIDETLQNGLNDSESSIAATESFLDQLSLFTQYHEEQDTRRLLTSKLSEDTLGNILGCDTKKLSSTYYKIKRRASKDTLESELWLSAIQCLEDTDDHQCLETLTFIRSRPRGYQSLRNTQDSTNSSQILKIKGVSRYSIKTKRRTRN